jgi:hydrogenase maturation protease
MKTLVLGIGNPILQDDGVGIQVAQQVRQIVHDSNVVIDTAFTGGLNLLDHLKGYEKVILIDAVHNTIGKPGTVERFLLSESTVVHSGNPHDVSLSEALLLAKKLGEKQLPKEIIIVGIVVNSRLEFGECLSDEIQQVIPQAVQMVLSEIKNT